MRRSCGQPQFGKQANAVQHPADNRNRHAVAEGAVARAVSSGLAAIRERRIAAREALEALTFNGQKPAYRHAATDAVLSAVLQREHRIAGIAEAGTIRPLAARRRTFADLQKRNQVLVIFPSPACVSTFAAAVSAASKG